MAGAAQDLSRRYVRRDPGSGPLFEVLATHLETFLARGQGDWLTLTPGLPAYVVRELRAYLRCGILAHGFARFHCFQCHSDALVAFACKGRGFCPSCGGRRMAESAAHLVDHVIPPVPVRQWVISFPWVVRYRPARRPALCTAVRAIFLRAVFSFYRERAAANGIPGGRMGAVNRIQRLGSALNLNVHFHVLLLDGVHTAESSFSLPVFSAAPELQGSDVESVVRKIRTRVLRLVRRRGLLTDEGRASSLTKSRACCPCFKPPRSRVESPRAPMRVRSLGGSVFRERPQHVSLPRPCVRMWTGSLCTRRSTSRLRTPSASSASSLHRQASLLC